VSDEPYQLMGERLDETLRAYGSVERWRAAIDAALESLRVSTTRECDVCQRRGQVYDLRRVHTTTDSYQSGHRCAKCVADVVGLVFTLDALVAAAPRKKRSA
jgi:hypothetical protein